MANATYSLTLTAGQADHLLRLVSVGQLALAEHHRTGWLLSLPIDAKQMADHVGALKLAPPIEGPMHDLGAWVMTQRKK